jgi:ABC-type Fe3+-hydroxamate transport system substrate-binding protein
MIEVTDQIGRTLRIANTPQRIICLVPSLSELLYDLDLEKELVGITKFCVHPTFLKKTKTIVGGTKKVNLEKIKLLNPDFILCNKEENTPEIVENLKSIAPVYVSDVNSIKDALHLISELGNIINKQEKAAKLIAAIQFKYNEFKYFIKDKPIQKTAYFIWSNPWMVAGNSTFINELLKLNKFENIYQNLERYPLISLEQLQGKNPSLVLLSSEPYPFKEKQALEISTFVSNQTKILFCDGELFSWYGSRLKLAFDYFKKLHQKIENQTNI